MRRTPQVLLLVLAMVFSSSFFGCSKSTGPEKGTVLLWHWLTDREDALHDLAERFKKETGIKVALELYAPSDAYASKVRAAAQTNTLPDIFSVLGESRDIASFINSGHVANISAAMEADHGAWKKQLFAKSLATNTMV